MAGVHGFGILQWFWIFLMAMYKEQWILVKAFSYRKVGKFNQNMKDKIMDDTFNLSTPFMYLSDDRKASKHNLTLNHTIPAFNDPDKEAFWKQYGKRRKCW